jgi:hypothetical protein
MQYCIYTIKTVYPQAIIQTGQRHTLLIPCPPEFLLHLIPNHRISIILEQFPLQERRNIIDLQILRPRFQLFNCNPYRFRVFTTLMTIQLDFLLDDLTKEEGNKFLIIGCLVNVFPKALYLSVLPPILLCMRELTRSSVFLIDIF